MTKKLILMLLIFYIALLFLSSCSNKEDVIGGRTLDKVKPIVEITSPENLYNSPTNTLTISGTSSDNNNVKEVKLKLNNGNWNIICKENCASWTYLLTLNIGYNTVYIQSVDNDDNLSPVLSKTYTYGLNQKNLEISELPPEP